MLPLILLLVVSAQGLEGPQTNEQTNGANYIYPTAQDRNGDDTVNINGDEMNYNYNNGNGGDYYQRRFFNGEAEPNDVYGPGVPISTGPWVTVPAGYQADNRDPFGLSVSGGLGFDTQSLVTWGLGAVIMLLLVSTVVQLIQRLLPFPFLKSLMDEVTVGAEAEGRSLEAVSSLAQFALEAMNKYEQLNVDEDQK